MIVILNNGTRIKISVETAQAILQELLKSNQAAEKWHCVMDTEKNQVSGFNLRQAAAICSEEAIVTEGTNDSFLEWLDKQMEVNAHAKDIQQFGTPAHTMYLAVGIALNNCREKYLEQ